MNNSIYLGGGCFWCIESVYKKVNGIISISPGYMGGDTHNPTYEEVCEGYTNHVEVVKLDYNEIITLNPSYAEAYCNLGVTLYELCRLAEAETYFNKAIAFRNCKIFIQIFFYSFCMITITVKKDVHL